MNLLNKLMKSTLLMLTMLTKNIFIKNLLKDMMMLKIRQRKPIQISFWKTLFKRLLVCSTTFSTEGKINQLYLIVFKVYHFLSIITGLVLPDQKETYQKSLRGCVPPEPISFILEWPSALKANGCISLTCLVGPTNNRALLPKSAREFVYIFYKYWEADTSLHIFTISELQNVKEFAQVKLVPNVSHSLCKND